MICVQHPVSVAARILPPGVGELFQEQGDVCIASTRAARLTNPRRFHVRRNKGEVRILHEFLRNRRLILPAFGPTRPGKHERRVHVDLLLDHLGDERRKELRIHRGFRRRAGGTRVLPFLHEQRARHRVHVLHVLHAHRDGVLDVLCVPEHPQAGGIRLLDDRAKLVVGDRQVDLDVIDAGGLELADVRARFGDVSHVAAVGRRRSARSGHASTRDEHPRSLDPPAPEGCPLREAPRGVVVNVGDRRHPVGQEHWQLIFTKMDVTVDEAWQDGAAVETNDVRAAWHRDLSTHANSLDARPLDDHQGVGDRRPAGAVDERAAVEHERSILRTKGDRTDQDDSEQCTDPERHH